MMKFHSNAEGKYVKADGWWFRYIVLISMLSALKLMDVPYVFEIFEIKVSVKPAHHQQIALIPEYKSTLIFWLLFMAQSTGSINTYS
jgi:hypothetical protein